MPGFDVAPDGQHCFVTQAVPVPAPPAITHASVVLNSSLFVQLSPAVLPVPLADTDRDGPSASTRSFRRKGRAMSSIVKFGEDVDGYGIPVLNEREIRAAAGLLFLMMFVAIAAAALKGSFLLLKYAIAIFLPDMLIRVFINPRFSPSWSSSSTTRSA